MVPCHPKFAKINIKYIKIMKTYFKRTLLLISIVIVYNTSAQQRQTTLSLQQKKSLISNIQTQLRTTYIDAAVADKLASMLDEKLPSKKYKKVTDPIAFAKVLTKDLQHVSKDLHLSVRYEPKRIAQKKRIASEEMKLKMEARMAAKMAEVNYGFTDMKILNGNIGYLNLNMFADTKYANQAATAAMNFLSNTNAIIIDLRNNRGGVPSMIQLLSTYFTDTKPVLLSNFYERKTGAETQLYTLSHIDGKRKSNTPLYILTSKQTFSAAEAFAYGLKHYKKATIVGEISKGGANRTKRLNLNDAFSISIPYIQSIHPITKSNWEGVGVQPDIKTIEKEALVKAYIAAIHKTVKRNKNRVFNKIGYDFLKENAIDNAIIVFKENTLLFPNDPNTWDSLGEAYVALQDRENALKAYEKALSLAPDSNPVKTMIQKLKSTK